MPQRYIQRDIMSSTFLEKKGTIVIGFVMQARNQLFSLTSPCG